MPAGDFPATRWMFNKKYPPTLAHLRKTLATNGDRAGAVQALEALDRMQARPEDREVREAAVLLRRELSQREAKPMRMAEEA